MACKIIKSATACVNWEEFENDSLDMTLGWGDENAQTTGVYYDVTGYTAVFQVRDSAGLLKIDLDHTNGITLAGPAFPNVLVVVPPALNIAAGFGKYTYGLELTPPNGKTNTLMRGKYVLINSVPE